MRQLRSTLPHLFGPFNITRILAPFTPSQIRFFNTIAPCQMPPKRNTRRNSSSSQTSQSFVDQASTPTLKTFSPKPCLTCGRVITPRAKWERNWEEIKTCSDSCKAYKIRSRVNRVMLVAPSWEGKGRESCAVQGIDAVVLNALDEVIKPAGREKVNGGISDAVTIDVDAWIELALLRCAASPSSAHPVLNMPITDDVEIALDRAARKLDTYNMKRLDDISSDTTHQLPHASIASLYATLQSGPGLRERTRRAARRLFVLETEHWACKDFLESSDQTINSTDSSAQVVKLGRGLDLLQTGKVLDGLEGASYAKGPIALRRRG